MSDLISRQDFDKFLEDAEKEAVKHRKYVFASALNTIRGNLRNFPSAQPERKKGKWIDCVTSAHWKCSECGDRAPMYWDANRQEYDEWYSAYCPNCGADMRGSEED